LTPEDETPILGAMSREYRILQVDVFTERVLAGNQLGVVPDARGLSDEEMQAIAREMNVAETTFVLPATRAGCVARIRIFTPGREMPFAGHPTIGTAWVLATERMVPDRATHFALDEQIGPVEVELEGDPARPGFVWMRHRDATFGDEVKERAGVAAALSLGERDLWPGAPIQTGSTGNAFLYVPLRDRATVDRAALDQSRIAAVVPDTTRIGVFVLAPEPDATARRVYTRMFAPAHGVAEDPATGSASGALGAYLAIHGLVAPARQMRIVSEQGTKMGRQSFVHITLTNELGAVSDIRVGGSVVPALDGTLTLP
jgi:trans-2,3-dihydro-3-hydroxyanthranilate isomerase